MGLVSGIATGAAKKIVKNAAIEKAVDAGVSLSEKAKNYGKARDEKKLRKLLGLSDEDGFFTISREESEKPFHIGKRRSRMYSFCTESGDALSIKRVLKKDGTSNAVIRKPDGKEQIFAIDEIVIQKTPAERAFVISENGAETGRVFANEHVPYRFVRADGETWDMMQNGEEFYIAKDGMRVSKCLVGRNRPKDSLEAGFEGKQPHQAILFLSLCLMFMKDAV